MYYERIGFGVDGVPDAFIEWLLKEQSGTTNFDTGTNPTGYDGTYGGTPTQISGDSDLGDCIEMDRATTDVTNMGVITPSFVKATYAIAFKSNDASNSGETLWHTNAAGNNSGDSGSTITTSSTVASFFVQTTTGELKTVTGFITNNTKHVILVTWDSVGKEIKMYIDDMATATATNTYTGTSVPFAGPDAFTIGDTNSGGSISAGFRANNFRIYNSLLDLGQRNAVKAIT